MGYQGSYLPTGGYLSTWDFLTSNNDQYTLVMQSDGNLCVYLEPYPIFGTPLIWQSGPTAVGGQFHAVVENSGALTVYAGPNPTQRGARIWTSGSSGSGGKFMAMMQPTGNLSLFAGNDPRNPGPVVWNAGPVPNPNPPPPALTPSKKLQLLTAFAPRINSAQDEKYFPCSVDWAYQFLKRYQNPDEQNKYCLTTIQAITDPETNNLPLFAGNLAGAKVYAFWVDKAGGFHDLICFVFYGYNQGKPFLANTIGNHVGDWEHVSIRLDQNLLPVQALFSYHEDSKVMAWSKAGKAGRSLLHLLVYSATGSHAMYSGAGDHAYGPGPPWVGLVKDTCSDGLPLNSWNALETYDYNARKGLGPSLWPRWMDTDYLTPGAAPAAPAGNTIYRWGNRTLGFNVGEYYELDKGPTGPPDKGDCWNPNLFG